MAPSGIWLGGITVEAIDPVSNRVVKTIDQTGITVAYGYGSLWVTDTSGRILRIDPQRAAAR